MKHLLNRGLGLFNGPDCQRIQQGVVVTNGPPLMDFASSRPPVFGRSLVLSPCIVAPGLTTTNTLPKISDAIQLTDSRSSSAKWSSIGVLQKPAQEDAVSCKSQKTSKFNVVSEQDTINEIRHLLARHTIGRHGSEPAMTCGNRIIAAQNGSLSMQSFSSSQQADSSLALDSLNRPFVEAGVDSGISDEAVQMPRPRTRKSHRRKSAKSRKSAKAKSHAKQSKDVKSNERNLAMTSYMIIKGAVPQQSNSTKGAIGPNSHMKSLTPRTTQSRNESNSPTKQSVNSLRSSQEDYVRKVAQSMGSKITKVYCSEKMSGDLLTDGITLPCAPPVTPTLEMFKKYEYIPSLCDIKSQRMLRLRLQTIEKQEKKKQDKLRKERVKQDEQLMKEKEKQKRHRQRQEIYALNAVMTKLEYDRFVMYCKSKGIPLS